MSSVLFHLYRNLCDFWSVLQNWKALLYIDFLTQKVREDIINNERYKQPDKIGHYQTSITMNVLIRT